MMKVTMKRWGYPVIAVGIALGLIGLAFVLLQNKRIDVLMPAGDIADQQRSVLYFALFLSSLVVVPVFSLLIYFCFKYRAGNKKARYQPEWAENKWLEGLWWGIPIFIIGILGVVTYQTSHSLDPYKPLAGQDKLEVQVIALRWKWLFIYPEQNIATLNHLPIPVDTPVRFTMTADAPMSAFWIPALGSQIYAMNGMDSQLNLNATKPGEYTGYTTNINGEGYAKMTFKAKAMPKAQFASWAAGAENAQLAMNVRSYEQLAEPKSETDERTYRLANVKLYQYVVSQYGGHNHRGHHE